jgi:hypothetical protein
MIYQIHVVISHWVENFGTPNPGLYFDTKLSKLFYCKIN